jgi:hypothetical protein
VAIRLAAEVCRSKIKRPATPPAHAVDGLCVGALARSPESAGDGPDGGRLTSPVGDPARSFPHPHVVDSGGGWQRRG